MAISSTSFQKGQVGNPKGRKPLPEDVKIARGISTERLIDEVIRFREMKVVDGDKIDKNELDYGERMILEAYQKRDYQAVKYYEDRAFGKAKESIDLTTENIGDIIINVNGITDNWNEQKNKDI